MKPQNSQNPPVPQKLIIILGPTSSGKTGLAQKLCKEFNGFIISADSRQVYRYMDIGTGKVDTIDQLADLKCQRQQLLKMRAMPPLEYVIKLNDVDHYMIDIVEPSDNYNVALYQREIYNLISKYKIQNTKYKIPFLVGGTGLYIDAVVDNWQFPKGEPNLELRKKIENDIKTKSLDTVWQRLIKLDPMCKNFVQKQNPRRLVRALEYILSTGKKFSQNRGKGKRLFEVLKIGIKLSREELYKRIDQRVNARIKMGMIEEVAELMLKHKISYERLQQFGLEYRVISSVIARRSKTTTKQSQSSIDSLSQRLKWNIHAYARRQLTWFRRDCEIRWVSGYEEAKELAREFLTLP